MIGDKIDGLDASAAQKWREDRHHYEMALLTLAVTHTGLLDMADTLRARHREVDVEFATHSTIGTLTLKIGKPLLLTAVTVSYASDTRALNVRSSRHGAQLPTIPIPQNLQDAATCAKAIVEGVAHEVEILVA